MKTPDRKRLEEIMGQFMNEAIALHRISGAEIKILQNDEPLLEAVYGNKTLTEPLTPGCIYRIASMTKPITALAFLLACDEGLMAPEDELKTYLPAFDRMPVAKETPDGYEIVKTSETPILMWHLLSHVSGIGCDDLGNRLFFDEIPLSCKQSLTDVVNAIAQQPLAFEPMTKSAYSATASFDVLARVIEITSGRPFEAYIKERICDPLGMIHTSFFPSREEYKNMITLTDVDKDNNLIAGKTTPGCVFENLGYPSAGAGLASTADDYVKFASFLLHDGLTADGR